MPDQNHETGGPDAKLRERHIKFVITSQGNQVYFDIELQVPQYIVASLSSAEWHQVAAETTVYACQRWHSARRAGVPADMVRDLILPAVKKQASSILYSRFTAIQIKRGNGSWRVPETLQWHTIEHLTEENVVKHLKSR